MTDPNIYRPGELVIVHNWRTNTDDARTVINQEFVEDTWWLHYETVEPPTLENGAWSGSAWWDEDKRRWMDGDN